MIIDKIFNKLIYILRNKYYMYKFNLDKCIKLRIYGPITVKGYKNIHLGDNIAINDNVYIQGEGGIYIEDNVVISAYAKIISTGLDLRLWNYNDSNEKKHIYEPIYINKGCWIGAGATILPGVNIHGKGVVIAANAVVSKDITEDNVIVAGVPGRIIKKIDILSDNTLENK